MLDPKGRPRYRCSKSRMPADHRSSAHVIYRASVDPHEPLDWTMASSDGISCRHELDSSPACRPSKIATRNGGLPRVNRGTADSWELTKPARESIQVDGCRSESILHLGLRCDVFQHAAESLKYSCDR